MDQSYYLCSDVFFGDGPEPTPHADTDTQGHTDTDVKSDPVAHAHYPAARQLRCHLPDHELVDGRIPG